MDKHAGYREKYLAILHEIMESEDVLAKDKVAAIKAAMDVVEHVELEDSENSDRKGRVTITITAI